MAERPIFVPDTSAPGLVRTISLKLTWHGGFAISQKKRNIQELHAAANRAGFQHILEVSTKSEEPLGQRLSAFNLKFPSEMAGEISIESAYQGSKVFVSGGPYTDLYFAEARDAKTDPRIRTSGDLRSFVFEGHDFPLEPKSVFYDWLYINAILPHSEWLQRLQRYSGFSDIEFNPQKSFNCQARACALFVSLMQLGLLTNRLRSPSEFVNLALSFANPPASQQLEPMRLL